MSPSLAVWREHTLQACGNGVRKIPALVEGQKQTHGRFSVSVRPAGSLTGLTFGDHHLLLQTGLIYNVVWTRMISLGLN